MCYLNLGMFSKHGCFGLHQISRTFYHGPDVCGCFGQNQMSCNDYCMQNSELIFRAGCQIQFTQIKEHNITKYQVF